MEPTQPNAGSKKYLIIFSVVVVIAIGSWYAFTKFVLPRQQSAPTGFSPNTQSVPKGSAPRDADQSLAAFGLSVAPPFFDKKNVVQSLQMDASASTSPATPSSLKQDSSAFLSYRIDGQNIDAIRKAFIGYFKEIGWGTADVRSYAPSSVLFPPSPQTLAYSSPAGKVVSVHFFNAPHAPGAVASAIVVVLHQETTPAQR